MKKVIIAGASGMVGSIVQKESLNSEKVSQVTSILRRPSGISHPKLKEIIHQGFLDFSEIKEHFAAQDVAHFCIGAYTGAVPDDKFKIITVDMAQSFSDAVLEDNPNVTFCLLSGAGADPQEKSRLTFARYKGMAENYLISKGFDSLNIFLFGANILCDKSLHFITTFVRRVNPVGKLRRIAGMAENYLISKGFDSLNIFRPAYIYPVEKRVEPNLMYRISRSLYPLLKNLMPGSVITSQELGKAMFKAGIEGANHGILENNWTLDIR